MNGQVLAELQEAHHNYGDAYAFQGDHCLAQDQYEAALAISPIVRNIPTGSIQAKRDQAAAACASITSLQSQQESGVASTTSSTPVASNPIGVRASPAPGGQSR